MKRLFKLLFIAVVATVSFTLSADDSGDKKYSDSEYALAYKYLEVSGTAKCVDAVFEAMPDTQIKMVPLIAPYRKALVEFFKKNYTYEILKKTYAEAHLDILTHEEITALINFYQTPIGKSIAVKQVPLGLRCSDITNTLMIEKQAALNEAIMDAMRKNMQ